MYLREQLEKLGVQLVENGKTNQLFIKIKRANASILMERYGLELWEDCEEEQVLRIVTSFATRKRAVKNWLNSVGQFCLRYFS